MRDAHVALGWALIIGNGLVGVWALAAHLVPALRHRAFWVAVVVAEVIVLVQVILGVVQLTRTDVEPAEFHELYGFAAFASVGIIYAYRNEMRDRPYLLYGFGSLWLMGLGVRVLTL